MSETKHPILNLNGHTLVDQEARDAAAQSAAAAAANAEEIGKLSEEIVPGAKYANWNMPILYLNGDTTGMTKDNAVNLAYVYGNLSGTASVKWQGSSSVDIGKKWGKFNYTVKFDQAFEAKDGWGEQKKYCLKANWIDASHTRNLLAAMIWGQMCAARNIIDPTLSDCPNWGAVDGFPCIIVLNGAFLGLYTFNVPKDGWMMNMPHDGAAHEAILCADSEDDVTCFKAPATLDGDFDIEYITDENDTAWAVESINRAINACINSDGSDIDTVIAQYIDIDSAIDYLIHAAVTANMDGMDRNYLLSTTDGVKWRFTCYDMDTVFGLYWGGTSFTTADDYPFLGNFAKTHRLMHLLYTYKADAVKARYKALRNSVLSEIRIARDALNFAGKIKKAAMIAEAEKWSAIPLSGVNNVYQIIEYLRMRFPKLDAEVEAMEQQTPISAPVMKAMASWYDETAAGATQDTITSVAFVPSYAATGDEDASWACDVNGNGDIIAYRKGTAVTVAPTTGAEKICLNAQAMFMFAASGSAEYGNFANLATVTGSEMFVAQNNTDASQICRTNTTLTTPVHIPAGVTNIKNAYRGCTALATPPVLPEGLLYMESAFLDCTAMNALPIIPSTVKVMNFAFQKNYGVTSVDGIVIPEGATQISLAFMGVSNASGTITINAQNLTAYERVFENAAKTAGNQIVLTGSCPLLAELAATKGGGNVVVG